MIFAFENLRRTLLLLIAVVPALLPMHAIAASCITQSQMTPAQRDSLSVAARSLVALMQNGDLESLRAATSPAAAADAGSIATSVEYLKPFLQGSTITINTIYLLDSSTDSAGSQRTSFYCGTPVVVMNLTNLSPGTYGLVLLHATGVPQPQQISIILSKSPDGRWQLGGFFDKPMVLSGRNGLWYWTAARRYAQSSMNWNAWFYYRIAANLLDPVDFLSSPNLDKLQHEKDQLPEKTPGELPIAVVDGGSVFQVTAMDMSTAFGGLDLDLHYNPTAIQAEQLRDPASARKQVTEIMLALLGQHPELREAFHGIWVHADQGTESLFSLELPMAAISAEPQR